MHVRAHGETSVLEYFAFTYIGDVIGGELEGIGHVLQCPPKDLSMEELCTLFIEDLILKLSTPGFDGTPQFWSLLLRLAWSDKQWSRNVTKVPDLVCILL